MKKSELDELRTLTVNELQQKARDTEVGVVQPALRACAPAI